MASAKWLVAGNDIRKSDALRLAGDKKRKPLLDPQKPTDRFAGSPYNNINRHQATALVTKDVLGMGIQHGEIQLGVVVDRNGCMQGPHEADVSEIIIDIILIGNRMFSVQFYPRLQRNNLHSALRGEYAPNRDTIAEQFVVVDQTLQVFRWQGTQALAFQRVPKSSITRKFDSELIRLVEKYFMLGTGCDRLQTLAEIATQAAIRFSGPEAERFDFPLELAAARASTSRHCSDASA